MTGARYLSGYFEQGCFDLIADGLAGPGWTVVDDFFGSALTSALRLDCLHALDSGRFRPAAVGSGKERRSQTGIRGDETCWLQQPALSDPQRTYLDRFEQLRLELNRQLQLGLFEFESHFARYPAGAGYSRHVDQFRGDNRRRLSSVLYLNQHWSAQDGGELRLYLDGEGARFEDVSPRGGRLVVFMSARFAHEVLPAKRERISIAGWFKRR